MPGSSMCRMRFLTLLLTSESDSPVSILRRVERPTLLRSCIPAKSPRNPEGLLGCGKSNRNKGACEQGPSIVTPPKDIWNVTGAQIYLSCEVIGIPTPVLIWNKIIRGQYGVQRMELLPGDRENLAIQTRGGPEKHEVTGWVLISPLSKEDAGEYECHASNAKGEATASAKIHVVETLHEIALTKDDGAEL
ncbi:insulin-like growth factor-binding protein 7 [Geospiza fortis]|uniref:Insulin-like growth factor-binding protein 7 n=1 Tax=Geospiza fortis TaxID=48883 RepID=A0A6I9HD14_GEOFO|nr:insulin-like growth factor-binding protein 7 [Geospiza fortis]